MFETWTHGEIINLLTAAAAGLAAVGTFWNARKAAALHLEINSRMTQLLAATRAQGGMDERKAQDVREDAKSTPTPQS